MKQHLISAAVAAAIAGGVVHYAPPKIEQLVSVTGSGKHIWPGLSDQEKASFTEIARTFPKNVKFDIVCNDAGCAELAADIDDAFEDAGIESSLDKALGPLGYGIGVQVNEFDKAAAEAAVAAINKVTDGRLDPKIVSGQSPAGYVTILIGKKLR